MTNQFIRWERSDDRYSVTLCESFTPGEVALLSAINIDHMDNHQLVALSSDDLRQLILTAVELLGRGPAEESPAFRRTHVRC